MDTDFKQEFAKLDKLLEHRSRFAICALLKRYDRISFSRFKELLNETDGNLGAQLKKLEDNGYVSVEKKFQDRKPITWYQLSEQGAQALTTHLEGLHAVIEG